MKFVFCDYGKNCDFVISTSNRFRTPENSCRLSC